MATPTPEEIQAAYDMVYNTEKLAAEHALALYTEFLDAINELAAGLPSQGAMSPVGQFVTQMRNLPMMYNGGVSTVRSYYNLPVNYYTVFRWNVNLHNLFHFLRLREDQHAQYEIQVFAKAIHDIIRARFPVATAAFENHIQNTTRISTLLATTLATVFRGQISPELIDGNPEIRDFIRRYADPTGAIDL